MRCVRAGEGQQSLGFLGRERVGQSVRGLLVARTRKDEQTTHDLATEEQG